MRGQVRAEDIRIGGRYRTIVNGKFRSVEVIGLAELRGFPEPGPPRWLVRTVNDGYLPARVLSAPRLAGALLPPTCDGCGEEKPLVGSALSGTLSGSGGKIRIALCAECKALPGGWL